MSYVIDKKCCAESALKRRMESYMRQDRKRHHVTSHSHADGVLGYMTHLLIHVGRKVEDQLHVVHLGLPLALAQVRRLGVRQPQQVPG